AMSAFGLRNQGMQRTEPDTDYIVPQMKLRDEVFVFIDGKWVNETYCQPPSLSHQKLFTRKAQNEWSIWEENRVLWQENQILRIKNRMLWEENKALQYLLSQNKAAQVIYTDDIQPRLQNENKPFPFLQERNTGFQFSPGNKALQAVQEKNEVFEVFQQENKTIPATWKDQKAIKVPKESKDVPSDLQKNTDTITTVEKGNPGPVPKHKHEGKKKSVTPTQDEIKSAASIHSEHEVLWVLRELCELLHIFLKMNHLPEQKQGCHNLYEVNGSFQEDYNKLKLHLNAVKHTMTDITAQMEMLEKEIIAITSPVHEEAGQKLATEQQLGDM
ncbi:SPERT protein, partial [Sakesphorus luctuosus]|nr:SPERT protein [Sakesphorus luctuosus]